MGRTASGTDAPDLHGFGLIENQLRVGRARGIQLLARSRAEPCAAKRQGRFLSGLGQCSGVVRKLQMHKGGISWKNSDKSESALRAVSMAIHLTTFIYIVACPQTSSDS